VELSFLVLVAGVLCGLWDQALGVRLYQAGKGTLWQRFAFAWKERRLTLIGSALVLVAAALEAFG